MMTKENEKELLEASLFIYCLTGDKRSPDYRPLIRGFGRPSRSPVTFHNDDVSMQRYLPSLVAGKDPAACDSSRMSAFKQ